jgi:formiminotetrahydrofolate cyclodeaminase
MEVSVWSATLGDFRDHVGGTDPVPAGVTISAVSATIALALLVKVLTLTVRRKNFEGDPRAVEALINGARRESATLTNLADDDVRAFSRYMEGVRVAKAEGREEAVHSAMREAIAVPMDAARSIVRALDLTRAAAPFCHTGLTAADLGVAAALLAGGLRAMLLTVEINLRQLSPEDPFSKEIIGELASLRLLAQIS